MENTTGVMFYYYFVCKRKLWFFTKDITMENTSDLVSIGKLIDDTTYIREERNVLIDNTINVDFIKNWEVIHEVKKSRKMDEAAKWQLKYYMWILKNKEVDIKKGILDYPLLRKREEVTLDSKDVEKILNALEGIEQIKNSPKAPKLFKKGICKNCSYYEMEI